MTTNSERWRRRRLRFSWRYVLLAGLAILMLLPVYLNAVNALLPIKYRFAYPPALIPHEPQLDGFRLAIHEGSVLRYMVNSLVVSALITGGQIATSCLGAYAFAFLRFPGRKVLYWTIAATAVVPFEAVILGNYRTIVWFHWLDSYPALTVPFLASGTGVFLLSRAFRLIPAELLRAGQIDGCGHLRLLRHVVMPVARPTIAALGVLSFLGAWSQYLWPKLVINENSRRTVQLGIAQLADGSLNSFSVLSAGAILLSIPLVLILIVFQRQLIRGLTAGLVER
jgi:sn-glycerol 3-phosphate transport system permease protein